MFEEAPDEPSVQIEGIEAASSAFRTITFFLDPLDSDDNMAWK